jgi:uncharacterized damage-inducible protein DinB
VNGHVAGDLAILEELYDDLIELVRPLDEAALNRRPPVDDANTIAVLVRHIAGSIGMWFARALDEPHERDRDAEFRAHDAAPALVEALEASRASFREQLARLEAVDLAAPRTVDRLAGPVTVTAGWCLAHAVRHTGEHWGQIQLTRDLVLAG